MTVQNEKTVTDWKKELQIMSDNCHPFIANVYGYSYHHHTLTIVMEYFQLGDLFNMLHKNIEKYPLSLIQRIRMAHQCASAIAHIHSKNVLHRDIKSMNILVSEDFTCKLTDFGCAKINMENAMYKTMAIGTPVWMAPEVNTGVYDSAADVFSLGLVLYEIFERKIPPYDMQTRKHSMPDQYRSSSVVSPCLLLDPKMRPTASQVVSVIDKMLNDVLLKVKNLMSSDVSLQSALVPTGNNNNNNGNIGYNKNNDFLIQFINPNLHTTYVKLMSSQHPHLVDSIIDKAYSMIYGGNPLSVSSKNLHQGVGGVGGVGGGGLPGTTGSSAPNSYPPIQRAQSGSSPNMYPAQPQLQPQQPQSYPAPQQQQSPLPPSYQPQPNQLQNANYYNNNNNQQYQPIPTPTPPTPSGYSYQQQQQQSYQPPLQPSQPLQPPQAMPNPNQQQTPYNQLLQQPPQQPQPIPDRKSAD
eukprot:TRINITY_DN2902_c0_g1_i1.p1 TRINITY_DN2902_c0_g1~~TRINITY_DN2902_c0_g1_i1.p1  ORF type:complete len:466 (-),score=128.10 TRINITY_DN2902_c0_g1_i1:22-1419(-)